MSELDLQSDALKAILLHTASKDWNDVKDMNWSTAEMLDVISKALLAQKKANGAATGEKQCNLPVVTVRYLLEVTTDKGNYLEQRIVNEKEDADKWLKFLNEEYKGYKITCLEINAR